MRIRATVTGKDTWLDSVTPFVSALGSRLSAEVTSQGYSVLDIAVDEDWTGFLGTTFRADLTLESGQASARTEEVRSMLRAAALRATSYEPFAVAITSQGESTPTKPSTVVGEVTDAVGGLVTTVPKLTTLLLVGASLAALVLVFGAAKKGTLRGIV